jgi:hypothetical protein
MGYFVKLYYKFYFVRFSIQVIQSSYSFIKYIFSKHKKEPYFKNEWISCIKLIKLTDFPQQRIGEHHFGTDLVDNLQRQKQIYDFKEKYIFLNEPKDISGTKSIFSSERSVDKKEFAVAGKGMCREKPIWYSLQRQINQFGEFIDEVKYNFFGTKCNTEEDVNFLKPISQHFVSINSSLASDAPTPNVLIYKKNSLSSPDTVNWLYPTLCSGKSLETNEKLSFLERNEFFISSEGKKNEIKCKKINIIKGFSGTKCSELPFFRSLKSQNNSFEEGAAETKTDFFETKCGKNKEDVIEKIYIRKVLLKKSHVQGLTNFSEAHLNPNINRFDGGAAEVKDEFLGTKCREIIFSEKSTEKITKSNEVGSKNGDKYIYLCEIQDFPRTKCREIETYSDFRRTEEDGEILGTKYRNFVFSKISFLVVQYTHPELKEPIDINVPSSYFIVENELYSAAFVLRCLQYQPKYYIFDDRYVLQIIDNEINTIELKSDEYIYIKEDAFYIKTFI